MSDDPNGQRPTDEMLLAYADGTLSAEEAARVSRMLEDDPESRGLVESMRRSGVLAAEAYAHVLDEPVPERLVAAVLGASAARPSGDEVSLEARRARRTWAHPALTAMAAALLLTLGTVTIYLVGQRQQGPVDQGQLSLGKLPAGSQLAQLLEARRSNDPVTIGGAHGDAPREAMIVGTIRDGAGRVCREIELISPGQSGAGSASPGGVAGAIACRGKDGRWSIEGAVQIAADAVPAGGDFNPASGGTIRAPLETILAPLGRISPLSLDDEARLIGRAWQP